MKTRKMRGGEIKRTQLTEPWSITKLGEGRVKEYREAEEYVFNQLALNSKYLDSNLCLQLEESLFIETYKQMCDRYKQDMANTALYDILVKIKNNLDIIEDRRKREDIARDSASRGAHELRRSYWDNIRKSIGEQLEGVEKAIHKKARREERERLIETNTAEITRIGIELKTHLELGELEQMLESDRFVKTSKDSLVRALNSQIPLINATMEKDMERHPESKDKIQEKATAAIRSIEERVALISVPLEYCDEYIKSLREQYTKVSELMSEKERLEFEIKGFVRDTKAIEAEREQEAREEKIQYEAALQAAKEKAARLKRDKLSEKRGESAEETTQGQPALDVRGSRNQTRAAESQDDVIEEAYQLALQRIAEEQREEGGPAEKNRKQIYQAC
jgi:hypothetical protein